jgi:tetratricopeptide (TPR) repeat protein
MASFESVRFYFWRHRKGLAALYLALLGGCCGALYLYYTRVPYSAEIGATVALRSLLYDRTFRTVDRARAELEAGRPERAERLLLHFLEEHADVQPGQLYTHAVTDAHETLADLYRGQGKLGKAAATLEAAVRRTPLHYWIWYRLGQVQEERGRLAEAADCLREAFRLTLDHPDVVNDYLGVLAELVRPEEIVEVADHFERASRRAAPIVTVKAGPPRPELQRRVLAAVGIPVEHGEFYRSEREYGLPRGPRVEVEVPVELVAGLPRAPEEIRLQLRFQNVYDGLVVHALRWEREDGTTGGQELAADQVAYLHRPHSGVEFHAELAVALPPGPLTRLAVVYSCPRHELSAESLGIVENARRNVLARGRP